MLIMLEGAGAPIPEPSPGPTDPRLSPPAPARVLIVEDSFMTARSLARLVRGLGVEVIGPAPTVQAALALIEADGCDAAVLDINLGNETVEPVAERLAQSGRPFVFVSGYASPKLISDKFRSSKLLSKPVDPVVFTRAVREMLPGGSV